MFKKFPLVKQTDSKDCGPAALLTIIEFYNGYVRLEKLKDMMKTNKNGTNAYNLINAAKEIGFECNGYKVGSIEEINQDNIKLPCIVHVILKNSYQHYMVIYKIDYKRKKIVIGDPASKIKKMSYDEFSKIWTNVLIMLYPIKSIPIDKNDNSLVTFIKQIIKPHYKLLSDIFVLSLLTTLFSIVASLFFKCIVDSVDYSNDYILFISIIFLIIYLFRIITDFFRNKLLIIINHKLDLNLTLGFFKQIINLPYHYYKNRTTGDLLSRVNDLSAVKEMISKVSLSLFVDLPLTVFSLIFLYLISKTLFVIAIMIFVIYVFIILLFDFIFKKYIGLLKESKASVTSYIIESINGFEAIKGLNIEENINQNFTDKYADLLNKSYKYNNYANQQLLLQELVNNVGFICLIGVGILLVKNNTITLGELLTFNSLLLYFLEPIKNIMNLQTNVKEANICLKRVMEIPIKEEETGIIDSEIKGNIVFKNLFFSHNNIKNVLKNVNLEIKDESKVLILGKSGGGKSTLLKLLMKYYPIDRNKIIINNLDINDYTKKSIDNSVAYISQNETLFTDTIMNNLLLGREINNNDITKVTNICHINEVLNNNLGYNMLIEENGFNLSGGEKQRIILGRTLLKKFNILIIDEGLNQIDKNLERKILKNIFLTYHDKTIIVISHRLENIDLFDHVVEFKNGRIVKNIINA